MIGVKIFFIYKEKIFPVSIREINDGIIKRKQLANKEALYTEIMYITENDIPTELVSVTFIKAKFNKGMYDFTSKEAIKGVNNRLNQFIIESSYELANDNDKLIQPLKPTLPNNTELATLKDFLNKHYPELMNKNKTFLDIEVRKMKNKYRKSLIKYDKARKEMSL